ncbi:hypothetical protein [Geothrix fuzhouensis]|uniref:hypothetical protein n=1 Tax=Geothrix fuzhouensis TaxID=2966451 RepID=UPI00214858BD|nr:hypothetical protein [Geothrix fuzhouensis]
MMNSKSFSNAKSVVHSKIGPQHYETLEWIATTRGISMTQALRSLLEEARQQETEAILGSRLDGLARTLTGVIEQQARHATRIEALVSILRGIENAQVDRETQILQTQGAVVGMTQLVYAHLLAMVEGSSRADEISASAQKKIQALRGEA